MCKPSIARIDGAVVIELLRINIMYLVLFAFKTNFSSSKVSCKVKKESN